jgi:hypothetical protein
MIRGGGGGVGCSHGCCRTRIRNWWQPRRSGLRNANGHGGRRAAISLFLRPCPANGFVESHNGGCTTNALTSTGSPNQEARQFIKEWRIDHTGGGERLGPMAESYPCRSDTGKRTARPFANPALSIVTSASSEMTIQTIGSIFKNRRNFLSAPAIAQPGPDIAASPVHHDRSIHRPNSGRDRKSPKRRCRTRAMRWRRAEVRRRCRSRDGRTSPGNWRSRSHLPQTSRAQVTTATGATVTLLETRRRSRLSRGRSIKRCGQRLTGWRNRYVVL